MIYLLAPAFNEAQNLPSLLKSVKTVVKKNYRLIIVSDGSTDNTMEVLRKLAKDYPVIPIGYQKNQGPGYAFHYGFKYLMKKLRKDDVIITIESDNTSQLSKLNEMILLSKSCDVVVGSPFSEEGSFKGVSFHRRFLSRLNHSLLKILFRIQGADSYSNFFRLYRANIIKKAGNYYGSSLITESGFSSVTEILIKLNKIGAKITSVPVKIDWSKRQGKSKLKILRYVKRQIMLVIKFWILSKFYLAPHK